MRINQIARKHGLENKAIIEYLESIGVHGKSHSSSLDDGTIELLLGHFNKLDEEAEKQKKEEEEEEQKNRRRFAKIRRPKGWKPTPKTVVPKTPMPEATVAKEEQPQPPAVTQNEAKVPEQPEPLQEMAAKLQEPKEKPKVPVQEQPEIEEIQTKESKEITPIEEEPVAKESRPAEEKVEFKEIKTIEKIETPSVPEEKPAAIPEPQKEETKEVKAKQTLPEEKPKDVSATQPASVKRPAPSGKKDKKQAKRSQKKAPQKDKPKVVQLEKETPVKEPEFIIEAPEIDPAKLREAAKERTQKWQEMKPGKEDIVKRDQDEAIRREIQKLKLKQKRKEEHEESKKTPPPTPTERERRREPTPPTKGKGKRAWKREKRERRELQMAAEEKKQQMAKTVLKVHDATTVADVADGLGIPVNELIQQLIGLGVMATINQRLDLETIQIIADEYNFKVEQVDLFDSDIFSNLWEEDTLPERMCPRPPVVTIMGHVDHGKTKLLDAVRESDIVSQEAGGITQHIGAYFVKTPSGEIVFLDTPGHEAFTAMRARGAMVTDIVILVVAATEGVMPQTAEAIHHAKAAGVPIVVAMNKMDLEGANPDRIKQKLSEHGLITEEWGGDTVMVPISAKQKTGIDSLLEAVLLQAEFLELKADPECRARGTIVEGRLEQGRGSVATVLLQHGTLKIGDPFVTGVYSGRVRAMLNDKGEQIAQAGPAMPVEIIGLEDVPTAGDPFIVVTDDSQAKQISTRLQQIQRERELKRTEHITLEDLHNQIEKGAVKELRLIIKGDVQGSVGALNESLNKIESQKVRIEILHSGVGSITESDVMLASASNALIIGFNVRPHPQVMDLAKREHVDIRMYRVIYDVITDIKKAMTGMLDKTYKEKYVGRSEIREVFRLSKGISIAGSYVQDGRLLRNAPVRLLRDSIVVHEGRLSSLKRFKDDVREVQSGYECGIGLEQFNDIRVGDVLECYQMEEVAPTL